MQSAHTDAEGEVLHVRCCCHHSAHLPPSLGSTVVGMATAGLAALAEFCGMMRVVFGLGGLLLVNKVNTSEGRRPGFSGFPLL